VEITHGLHQELYIDTISNAIGCDSILTINLTILPLPSVTIIPTGATTFCAGDSVILSANAGLSGYQWYRWANPILAPQRKIIQQNPKDFINV